MTGVHEFAELEEFSRKTRLAMSGTHCAHVQSL
jgi:hypothetical protein